MEITNLFTTPENPPEDPSVLKITDIKQALRNENRVNIFINQKFSFSLDLAQVVDLKIKIGKVLTPEELEECKQASEFGKLYQRTLEWVLTRPHSIQETETYLKRKQHDRSFENRCRADNRAYKKAHPEENPYKNPDFLDENGNLKFKNSRWAKKTDELPEISTKNIEAVMSRLIEKGYLNDSKFAEFYVENRFVKKGVSKRRLRQELQKKGVSQNDIDNAFAAIGRNDEEEIKKIIAKKRNKYPAEKLINYLVRQGFDYQLAQKLVHETD